MSIDELELPAAQTPEPPVLPEASTAHEEISLPLVAAAAFLATASTAWTVAGLFSGILPRVAAILAAALGVGIVGLGARARRPALVQALALPAVGVAALVFAVVGGRAHGGIVGAVSDALHGGGPSGEAISFDAGWRLIIVVFIGALGAGACSVAMSTRRARLAVMIPVPPMIAAALVQPKGSTLSSGVPAMALLLGALVASYGVELAVDGASSGRFELRRVGRGMVAIAAIAALLVGVSRAGFLFPVPDQERVIPPQLPPVSPPLLDRELFTVRSATPGPWRLGVLDVYDGTAWRLPPYDPARFVPLAADGAVPGAGTRAAPLTATFTVSNLAGPVMPAPAGAVRLAGTAASFDPRTQAFRAPGTSQRTGTSYTVTAAKPPTGKELSDAAAPPRAITAEFLSVPAKPPAVTTLLADSPRAPLWDRLQFVRAAFYRSVVASGQGQARAVPPARVAEILAGKPATPYEITAAETLLARWAAIPARIGYGFFAGDVRAGVRSVHPRHAATWLDVYFAPYGWVPIVGVPPRAQQSLNQRTSDANPSIRPTEQLALVLYVPVRLSSIRLIYEVARYWILVGLPFVAGALLLLLFYPGLLKVLRTVRRRRWAQRLGARARIAVAYAELRDLAIDLNVAEPALSPFEFSAAVSDDDELDELTWLTTRALWGDLQRDLHDEDADAAERLARSVASRLRRAQPAPTRLLAVSARASLRDPYLTEIPNLWRPRRRPAIATAALLLVLIALPSCGRGAQPLHQATPALPAQIVPVQLGDVAFRREPAVEKRLGEAGVESLIDAARVFTFLHEGVVQGYLEVASFKPDAGASKGEVRRGVLQGIGSAPFTLARAGALRVYTSQDAHRQMTLWFAPDGSYFELLVARRDYGPALPLLARVLEFQGQRVGSVGPVTGGVERIDPRRGATL